MHLIGSPKCMHCFLSLTFSYLYCMKSFQLLKKNHPNLYFEVFYLPHMKSVVFDRHVAFVGGIDFGENRDDTPSHRRPNERLVKLPIDGRHPAGNAAWKPLDFNGFFLLVHNLLDAVSLGDSCNHWEFCWFE